MQLSKSFKDYVFDMDVRQVPVMEQRADLLMKVEEGTFTFEEFQVWEWDRIISRKKMFDADNGNKFKDKDCFHILQHENDLGITVQQFERKNKK